MMELAKGAAGAQEIVDAGGVAALVAAMGLHTADAVLQRHGCAALFSLSCGDATCKWAVVGAGAVAALLAAMGQHASDAELQRDAENALQNLSSLRS